MLACRTYLGSLNTFVDISAVRAMPFRRCLPLEYFTLRHVPGQLPVSLLVELLHLCNLLERGRYVAETLFLCHLFHVGVDLAPLHLLTICRSLEIRLRISHDARRIGRSDLHVSTLQILEEDLGMLLLVTRSFDEYIGDLLIALFACHAGREGIPVSRLGLPCKSC